MRRDSSRRFIPRENKSSADKRKKAMYDRFNNYRPECLFVIGAGGQICREPAVHSHTIAKEKVLTPIKGRDKKGRDNQVLVTIWGVGAFSHLFMSSSEEQPIDLIPSTFEPHPQGVDDASTGRFACAVHEPNIFDSIDVAEPDFTDPEVLFLVEYRTYLYANSLLLWGRWMYDDWNREIMRSPNVRRRAGWIKKRDEIRQLLPQIEAVVSHLGELWFGKKKSANVAPQVVSGQLFRFRSSLKFAACMFYGRSSAVAVFPTGGDWHGMGIARLIKDEEADDAYTAKLVEAAEASITEEDYSISVLTALNDAAGGVTAMSPGSYKLLTEKEQLSIGGIVAANSNAEMMSDILNQ